MTLDADEFIRRFLIHVLPQEFQRIRYYGFLGNRYRKEKLAHCRELLGMQQHSADQATLAKATDGHKVEDLTSVYEEVNSGRRFGRLLSLENHSGDRHVHCSPSFRSAVRCSRRP